MPYVHPSAYLLGIEGVALLRSFAGDFDREFAEARIAEIRRLLDDEMLGSAGVLMDQVTTAEGYQVWSETYDQPGNGAFMFEEPYVHKILESLPTGSILDAACGTGRHAAYLATKGHHVIGVDSSPDMLAKAREKVPSGEFRLGELDQLPLSDDAVDAIVCSLALTHVPVLGPVMAEFARVLRPGGHLVISDMHAGSVLRGSIPKVVLPDGRPARVASYRHLTGDYLRAVLPLGFRVRSCEEPHIGMDSVMPPPRQADAELMLGTWQEWPWNLGDLVPLAAWAANARRPVTVIWHFQLGHASGA